MILIAPFSLHSMKSPDIFDAVDSNDIKRVKRFIRNNGRVNIRDTSGHSPLHRAVSQGHHIIVALLLHRGYADPNVQIKDDNMHTPLHCAASQGDITITQLLIGAGARTDVQDGAGYTPLHTAVFHGKSETVQLFLEKTFVNLSLTNNNGVPPLLTAIAARYTKVVQLLLKAGADPSAVINGRKNIIGHIIDLVAATAKKRDQEGEKYYTNMLALCLDVIKKDIAHSSW